MADEQDAAGDPYELSPSGQPIYRHRERSIPFQPASGDAANIERIADHIERHFGGPAGVFHELVSDLVHLDVHLVSPTPERDYFTLITSGMSDAPMTVPPGAEAYRYAELLIQLPADWPLHNLQGAAGDRSAKSDADRAADERWYWPVRWLKTMARMPHEYDTWLAEGHTVPNGDPPEPFADDTKLCGMLLVPPIRTPEGFATLEVSPDKTIHFYSLIPIYAEEMDLKLRDGFEALIERFQKHDLSVIVDPHRPNVARRRKWLGLF